MQAGLLAWKCAEQGWPGARYMLRGRMKLSDGKIDSRPSALSLKIICDSQIMIARTVSCQSRESRVTSHEWFCDAVVSRQLLCGLKSLIVNHKRVCVQLPCASAVLQRCSFGDVRLDSRFVIVKFVIFTICDFPDTLHDFNGRESDTRYFDSRLTGLARLS